MMPERPIRMGLYGNMDAYLVDMGNRVGFSGSPVFITGNPGRMIWQEDPSVPPMVDNRAFIWLYGLCCGVFPDEAPVLKRDDDDNVSPTEFYTPSYTGMAIIIPVRKIAELLESDQLVEDRTRESERMNEVLRQHEPPRPENQIPVRFDF